MNYELSRKKIIIFRVSLAFLFSVSFALLPLVATAALVPCGPGSGGDEVCTWGHFYVLAENVIEFMIYYIAIPLSVIFFAIGGILIMTAAGSEERFKKGKSTLTAAAIGLIIVLCSWLIIGLIIQKIKQKR